MDLNLVARGMLGGLLLYFLVFVLIVRYQRSRWRRKPRLGRKHWGYYPTSSSIGNALQTLQVFVHPQMDYVLEEKLNEDTEEDDQGDRDDPKKALGWQLRRIRNGERVDGLRVPGCLYVRRKSD